MKRFLLVNVYVALLCFGTIMNVLVYIFCWSNFHGFLAGMFFIGVFLMEWILTLLTERYGTSWKQKLYSVAFACCYVVLAVAMSIGMIEKPIFHGIESVISPTIDSILFSAVALFMCALCTAG